MLYQLLIQDLKSNRLDLVLTFSNNLERISLDGRMGEFRPFRVLEKGPNHVLIEHLYGPHSHLRLDFGDDGRAFWVRQASGSSLRFEKATEPSGLSQ